MSDCISRQATLEPYKDLNDDDVISVWLIRKNIEQQPSVTPTITMPRHLSKSDYEKLKEMMSRGAVVLSTERTGHWITLDYQKGKFECSECHTQGYVDTCMYKPIWEFCPRCGADMRGE